MRHRTLTTSFGISHVLTVLWRFPSGIRLNWPRTNRLFLQCSLSRARNVIYDPSSINIINNIVSHPINIRVSLVIASSIDNEISYFFFFFFFPRMQFYSALINGILEFVLFQVHIYIYICLKLYFRYAYTFFLFFLIYRILMQIFKCESFS